MLWKFCKQIFLLVKNRFFPSHLKIIINFHPKISRCHPEITSQNIVTKDMNKFRDAIILMFYKNAEKIESWRCRDVFFSWQILSSSLKVASSQTEFQWDMDRATVLAPNHSHACLLYTPPLAKWVLGENFYIFSGMSCIRLYMYVIGISCAFRLS